LLGEFLVVPFSSSSKAADVGAFSECAAFDLYDETGKKVVEKIDGDLVRLLMSTKYKADALRLMQACVGEGLDAARGAIKAQLQRIIDII
jgi:hypothetical protein